MRFPGLSRFPKFPRTIKSHWLILALTCYFAFALNLFFWHSVAERIELTNGAMWLFALSLPCVIFVFLLFIFNSIVVPWIGKPLIILLILIAGISNYFAWTLGVCVDEAMIRNILETDAREASDFMSLKNFFWIFVSAILPAIILSFIKIRYHSFRRECAIRILFFILIAGVIGLVSALSYKEYASFFRNNAGLRKTIIPFNYVSGIAKYLKRQALASREFVWLDKNAHIMDAKITDAKINDAQRASSPDTGKSDAKKSVMIFIMGETARAANFSLQGYARETNPLLSQQDIFYFRNTLSCGTATAISVPCVFSSESRKKFSVDDAKVTQNLLDTLVIAGYDVSWLENDGGCKGVCDRVPTENMVKGVHPEHCREGYCRDAVLLEGLEEKIRSGQKNMAIFLHTMGSHGPSYYQRYPHEFRKFTPTCDTADIQNCPLENIVNTYDNTVLYTDYILSNVIDIAKKFPGLEIGVMYASDHGESLGEGNIYLHGFPYSIAPQEQKHIPFLFWMSESAQKARQLDRACLAAKAARDDFSHDHIFHSILGFLNVRTRLLRPELDLFQGCRNG